MDHPSSSEPDSDIFSSPIAERDNSAEIEEFDISIETPPDFSSWAPCKKQAWENLKTCPNQFFYRHVLPSEVKRNGPWTSEEKQSFIKAVKECTQDGHSIHHWGLFAHKYCPGRVGYQCNAYYKKLVISGEIEGTLPETRGSGKVDNKSDNRTDSEPEIQPKPKSSKKRSFFSGTEYAYMNPIHENMHAFNGFFEISPESFKTDIPISSFFASNESRINLMKFSGSLFD